VINGTVLDGSTRSVMFAVAAAPAVIDPNEQAIGPPASAEHEPWLAVAWTNAVPIGTGL
jgi:hypothetical protein